MAAEATAVFAKEVRILLPSTLPSLFLRRYIRIVKFSIEAKALARARPLCLRGPIRARLRRTFAASAATAALTGVLVSCME